ncbi:BrnA antitoxin family protein [Anabaena sp. UHCC 0253]|uniref:BrnA antitoxin family protein n=1 Tax=Anabaena sp. UHCC 0253 TaxID=2590019 RepID=UPI0020C2DC5A|nr:BrnA antitoxin family protein [Anabaena sp. UHCC 0253]
MNKSLTDWQRLETMEDEDIDFSDCPEITPSQFAKATVHRRTKYIPKKEPIMLNIDKDVIEWFKSQGESYQNQINDLLRDYMQTHQS